MIYKVKIETNKIKLNEADVVIIPVFLETEESPIHSFEPVFNHFKDRGKFKGEHGEIFTTVQFGESGSQDLIFVGLGKEEELTGEKIRISLAKAFKKANALKTKKLFVQLIDSDKLCLGIIVKAIVEGIGLGAYKFDKYKTEKKEEESFEVSIGNVALDALEKVEAYIDEASTLVETTVIARDLVNEPANVLYPESLAQAVMNFGKKYGFEVEVFDEIQIDEMDMKAFMSVAQGSDNPPRLIVMRYFGDKDNNSEVLGLVGKGLTYDAGGYSLKTNSGMVTMKSDMAGAAAVIGAISAIAKRNLNVNVVGVVAACENLISGGAYKPGDIVGSMSGKTIEVMNTDAEGRLTLIDAVHYTIANESATKVVDIATLTGASLVALGETTTAVVTNDKEFYEKLEAASFKTGERVWMLPSFEEYKKLIKSHIADLKNVGGKYAGTITAGLFIGEFVQNKPWMHLDIAGTSWTDDERDYYSKGGTGAGVRTLYYFAKDKNK